ncbi:glycoside hydrolase family 13 protein [Acaryochloris marina]|uniref:glycoside hydrolase family 13 protein n=1 Tax=Acaryochloris marina TaxID=155978 RepID=UPI0021C29305|nr:alpha-glucosidase [Acaryochloris marina]BDM83303.1 oligo-1,6-glucosidase [Acaryochloris marina MBIC10699]
MSKNETSSPDKWWESAVFYQIYPLTFSDANGDGIGDLKGIIKRLDYLNDARQDSQTALGIDAIWLSPINKSPMIDNGYDISDYCDICPTFGTLEDFDLLLREAHQRNIKVVMDLVVNHTSDKHPWFVESRSSKDNPKSDWYLWQDPSTKDNVPNNWLSYFGGSGWTYSEARGQYYFHTFNKNQPDLNWRNPQVREAIFNVVRFWLDRGVDGFRLDASSVYSKDEFFQDNPIKFGASDKNAYNNQHHLYDKNLPENHKIIEEIRAILEQYGDRVLIGETFIDSRLYDSNTFYGANNDELHLPFGFEFPFSPWYPGYIQREIEKKELITPKEAWPTYFLDNHDIPRHLSRWIECSLCTDPDKVAKAAAALFLTIRGTPFLYYGQELGMVDFEDIPPEKQRDKAVVASPTGELPPARDGARTPMQWDASLNAGFSFGVAVDPWLPVHNNYRTVNIESELKDEHSVLNFYRQLIRVRKNSEALRKGTWRTLIHYPHQHLAYMRETPLEQVLVVINFSYEKPFETDVSIDQAGWRVLVSERFKWGDEIALPKTLQPFEISIYQKD